MQEKKGFLGRIDRPIFTVSAGITMIFVMWALIWPKEAENTFTAVQKLLGGNFGWSYLIFVASFVIFTFATAFSKYGAIRLGKDDEKPEYSTWSWFAMLFAAGMGIGLVYWSVAEPMMHYIDPPFGAPESAESAQIAMRYVFFHWGLHPWAIYAVVGLAMAYSQFRKGLPSLVSSTLYPLLGEEGIRGAWGKIVDILSVFATIFGVATSLGLGALQISSGLNYVYDLPKGTLTAIILIVVIVFLYITSAVTGINRGIKFLSNLNMLLALGLMSFVIIAGPGRFILDIFTNTIGSYLQHIVQMSFWTDPFGTKPGWVSGWTVFYWAWWIAWGPFVGAFIARISRGRTVREFVLGVVLTPTLMSFLWFAVMGGSAMQMEVLGHGGIAAQGAKDISTALFVMLQHLPWTTLTSTATMFLITVFFITSADSATFVMSMMTSGGDLNPAAGLKIIWGIIEGAVAITLLLAGGLKALQTASIASAFPFMLVMIAMCVALAKSFRSEFPK